MNRFRHLSLFITENCNLNCPYCFAAGREKTSLEPSLGRQAVDFFLSRAGQGPLHLSFWGGEPFLNFPLLKELVFYTRKSAGKKRVSFSVPTNATLLNRENLSFLLKQRISLSLSLDGLPESQNHRSGARGGDSFPLVMKGLEALAEVFGKTRPPVRKTVTPGNVKNMVADTEFFLKQGFRQLALSPAMEEAWNDEAFQLFAEGQREIAQIWLRYLAAGDPFSLVAWNDLWLLGDLLPRKHPPAREGFFCGAGNSMLAVDIHGHLFPCHRFVFYDRARRHEQLGSVETGLEPDKQQPYLMNHVASGAETSCRVPSLGDCRLNSVCGLLCPASNYALSGDIHYPGDNACRFYRLTLDILSGLAEQASGREDYRRYRSGLARSVYRAGGDSRFAPLFWQQAAEREGDRWEGRAAEILSSLRRRRNPGA